MATARKELEAARALIVRPGGWTKRAFARDSNGEMVSAMSLGATCFCALGAMARVDAGPKACTLLDRAAEVISDVEDGCVAHVNDKMGFEKPVTMFDLAIKNAVDS
jgi:hypothetical protein